MQVPAVYLIPSVLHEEGLQTIAPYITEAVKECDCFFVENERTARRFLKKIWKEMEIDRYEWTSIHKSEPQVVTKFTRNLNEGKKIGIISEAGCPGIADPGQILVAAAQEMDAEVKPLAGPNSMMLALMASGMNGQRFQFSGYLPIDKSLRQNAIRDLENESASKDCTQLMMETPYRNNQLLEVILRTCKPGTRLCIAADLTSRSEWIKTKTITDWKKLQPDLNKRLVVFLMLAGR